MRLPIVLSGLLAFGVFATPASAEPLVIEYTSTCSIGYGTGYLATVRVVVDPEAFFPVAPSLFLVLRADPYGGGGTYCNLNP